MVVLLIFRDGNCNPFRVCLSQSTISISNWWFQEDTPHHTQNTWLASLLWSADGTRHDQERSAPRINWAPLKMKSFYMPLFDAALCRCWGARKSVTNSNNSTAAKLCVVFCTADDESGALLVVVAMLTMFNRRNGICHMTKRHAIVHIDSLSRVQSSRGWLDSSRNK